jgi:hypothetical protein
MGSDATAKLFFGIEIDEDFEMEDSDIPVKKYNTAKGVEEVLWPENPSEEDLNKWREYREKIRDTQFNLDYYGCDAQLLYFAYIKGYNHSVDWGEVLDITPDMLTPPSQEQIDGLKEFCEITGIPWSEPSWKMVALYF